ncbi:hypothetical protein [Duncaniella dubosii]|uniref:hypothetical protein n=1 Tax=Duncaniella dubosii TaxID=2518971 RepID=UPI003F67D6B9
MMRKFRPFTPDLTLAVGGSTGIEAGCLYNARNGKQPCLSQGRMDRQPDRLRLMAHKNCGGCR